RLALLMSFGVRGHGKEALESGFTAYLMKPVRQLQLYDCLATMMSRPVAQADGDTCKVARQTLVTRHSLAEAKAALGRILLAEDNEINRQVAVSLLEKKGYRVDTVSNGLEALEALKWTKYAAVLMDCQMPQMDGFEATQAIRENERVSGQHIPIIALTANAMQGDRERCLAVGMDAYVSKPIRGKEVFDAIDRLAPFTARVAARTSEDKKSDGRNAAALDHETALARLGGDLILFRRLARLFLDSAPGLMCEIREAVSLADSRTVERASHKLKGSAGYLCAESVWQAAMRLETLGRDEDLSNAGTLLGE